MNLTSLSKPQTVFMIIVLASQIFLYGFRWLKADVTTSDFPIFYTAARLYHNNQNPYDLDSQCRFQSSIRSGECSGYAHTPILLPLYALLFNENYAASYWRWAVVQILLIGVSLGLLLSMSGNFPASLQSVLFPPIVVGLWFGNDSSFILTAVVFFVWLLKNNKELLAGLSLSLVVLKPQLALPLAIPLLFTKPRVFKGFFLGGLVLILYSYLLVGLSGFRGLIAITTSLSSGQAFGGASQAGMFNITGMLARLGIPVFWAWPAYALSIVAITLILKTKGVNTLTISLAIVLALFTCPHLFFYDLAYLAVPLLFVHPLAPSVGSLIAASGLLPNFPSWPTYIMIVGLVAWLMQRVRSTRRDESSAG